MAATKATLAGFVARGSLSEPDGRTLLVERFRSSNHIAGLHSGLLLAGSYPGLLPRCAPRNHAIDRHCEPVRSEGNQERQITDWFHGIDRLVG